MPRVNFLLVADLFHGLVVNLAHRLVSKGLLANWLQQPLHEELLACEFELALEVCSLAKFLVLGCLRNEDHVGNKLYEVVLLCLRRHWWNLAGFIFGHGEVALVNFDPVDLGHNRILVLGTRGPSDHDEQRQEGGAKSGLTRVDREAVGNWDRHKAFLGLCPPGGRRRTIRPTAGPWQWRIETTHLTSAWSQTLMQEQAANWQHSDPLISLDQAFGWLLSPAGSRRICPKSAAFRSAGGNPAAAAWYKRPGLR